MSDAIRVLFVCTANICRSAYAEVMARHLLGDDPSVEVSSAGVHLDRLLEPIVTRLAAGGVPGRG